MVVIQKKDKEIEYLRAQLATKDKLLRPYCQQQITADIIKIKRQFNVVLPNVDIMDQVSIASFVKEVQKYFVPRLEVQRRYQKYKKGTKEDNNGWRNCWENKGAPNDLNWVKVKNNENVYWYDVFWDIQEKLERYTEKVAQFAIVLSALKDIDAFLAGKERGVSCVRKVLQQLRPSGTSYQEEISILKTKLKCDIDEKGLMKRWRWLEK